MQKKKKRKIKLNWFNVFMFISACIGAYVLVHDFIVWGILPLINGEFITLTYFGMFIDLIAIGLIEITIQNIKES